MRILIMLFALALIACKESGSLIAEDSPPIDDGITRCQGPFIDIFVSPTAMPVVDSSGVTIGNYIATQHDCLWVRDAVEPSYHYAIDPTDGSMRESNGLIFSDVNCELLVGEEYNYPLHLSGDVYVFEFEGARYEYPIPGLMGFPPGTYYLKTPGGSCDLYTGDPLLIREVVPSAFARTFSGPVTL